MKTRLAVITALLMVALAGCAPPAAVPAAALPPAATLPSPAPTQPPPSPSAVVMDAAERLNAGDIEGGMAYWADDANWYIFGLPPDGSELIAGKENIRAELANEIAGHLRWEIAIETVVGNVVTSRDMTWLDITRQLGVAPLEATGQYLVEDGKIASYAWTIDPESLAKLKVAFAAAAPAGAEAAPETGARAGAPVSELSVTIAGGTCSIAAPVVLKAGKVRLTVDVQDQNRHGYAVVFLALDPGKDFMDLMAASTGAPPPWAHALYYEEVAAGTSKTYLFDADTGPLYGICFSKPPDHPIGNLGPLEVRR